jgi:aminoglycoside phosphotransferase (APT) family kinase protein
MMAGERGALMPAYARDAGRIERAFWRMVEDLRRPQGRCLLHGDPHPGNCFSDAGGSAGLYDWQTIACGPWAYDVGYAVTTALEPDQRRASERDLLKHYLDRLRGYGVTNSPRFDAAWDDYRRYIAYPLLIWPTNHNSHQAEDNIRALTARLGVAAADFDFFGLWGV